MKSIEKETQNWYREYYLKKGKDRNDLLTNPEVLFQHLAFEDSVISALRRATNLSRETSNSKILDVGCGGGGMRCGGERYFFQEQATGQSKGKEFVLLLGVKRVGDFLH